MSKAGFYSRPGRLTVRVRLPGDLLDVVARIADERGVEQSVLLGDLVASELPDALAEAARHLLGDAPVPLGPPP